MMVWRLGLVMLLASCANFQRAEVVPSAQHVGADRDAHGCIGSAGFALVTDCKDAGKKAQGRLDSGLLPL